VAGISSVLGWAVRLATAVITYDSITSISSAVKNTSGLEVLTNPDVLELLLDRFEIVSDHLDVVVDIRQTFRRQSFEIGLRWQVSAEISVT
jgi:hypothetical protein